MGQIIIGHKNGCVSRFSGLTKPNLRKKDKNHVDGFD